MARHPQQVRAIEAMKHFNKKITELKKSISTLTPEQCIGQLGGIVRVYFSDKLDLVRHAHTFAELSEEVGSRASTEPFKIIYQSCDSLTYRSGKSETNIDVCDLIKRAEKAVKRINRELS